MVTHPTQSLLVLMHESASEPTALIAYLETISRLRVQVTTALPGGTATGYWRAMCKTAAYGWP